MFPRIDWKNLDADVVMIGVCIAVVLLILAGFGFLLVRYFVENFGLPATVIGVGAIAIAIYLGIWFSQRFLNY